MDRRSFITTTTGLLAGLSLLDEEAHSQQLTPPAIGPIPVAFVLGLDATVIDFAGPWEVFSDVPARSQGGAVELVDPFEVFTVSDKTDPLRTGSGLDVIPDYSFGNAPQPKVIVIPAQREHTDKKIDWIRSASESADITMSVCTGAFLLAKTGLLDGKAATTHHEYYDRLASEFPKVKVQRDLRFVDNGATAAAGGLTSGIDLALHVVERYFGRAVAQQTAAYLEYQGRGWLDNSVSGK
jgi:transcriptional regulator GlxA family with amidase domain